MACWQNGVALISVASRPTHREPVLTGSGQSGFSRRILIRGRKLESRTGRDQTRRCSRRG